MRRRTFGSRNLPFILATAVAMVMACGSVGQAPAGIGSSGSPVSPPSGLKPPSSGSQGIPVELTPFHMQAGTPSNGWIDYSVNVALRNDGPASVLWIDKGISALCSRSLEYPAVMVDSSQSYVKTRQGTTYPATLADPSQALLPPQLLIKSLGGRSVTYKFRVAEQLAPTELVISPGLALVSADQLANYRGDSSAFKFQEASFDVSAVAELPPLPNQNVAAAGDAPQHVSLSDQVTADFPGQLTGQFDVELAYGNNSSLQVRLKVPQSNKDITQNQTGDLYVTLADAAGNLLGASNCVAALGWNLGPGQSGEASVKFTGIPVEMAKPPAEFLLTYYWDRKEATFRAKLGDLLDCHPDSVGDYLQLVDRWGSAQRQQIGVPDSRDVSMDLSTFQLGTLWTMQVQPGRDNAVKLTVPDGGVGIDDLDVHGPDGYLVPQDITTQGTEKQVEFYPYCPGSYYFTVVGPRSYQVVTSSK